ncbi:MAG: cbb3-type cytochrome c oxidase subunit I [Acidobacteria bacterium]|nr:cbb3-type cytochrome c oxidase subunit I [Acidobacteriota bacterium]
MHPSSASWAYGGRLSQLRAWLLFAVSALAIAGAFALLAVLTRTPAVQLLGTAEGLHRAIAGHVTFALLVWLLAFETVLWLLASPPECRPRTFSRSLLLASAGSGLLIVAVLSGRGAAVLTDYVSVIVDPLFFAGLALFAAGVGGAAWAAVGHVAGTRSLLQHGMQAAAVIGVLALGACGTALAWLLPRDPAATDFVFFQSLFWMTGHLLQFVNVVAMTSVWYLLLDAGFGAGVRDDRLARRAYDASVVLAMLLFACTVGFDSRTLPANLGLSVAMGLAAALPALVHAALVVGAIARRRRGWSSPEGAALLCSVTLFVCGIVLALARVRTGSSMWIPAHYHAVVVGGVTMAFMGLTYTLIGRLGTMAWPRLSAVQPWLYGLGMLLVVAGMNWAGAEGAPRKTFDPALGAAAARWVTPMNVMGAGGVVAVLGGAMFVLNALVSLATTARVRADAPVIPIHAASVHGRIR